MDQIGINAQEIRRYLTPMVALFVEAVTPVKDQMSTREAYKVYGRYWIDSQVRKGNLVPRISGNKAILSKADIECLRAAEKEAARLL